MGKFEVSIETRSPLCSSRGKLVGFENLFPRFHSIPKSLSKAWIRGSVAPAIAAAAAATTTTTLADYDDHLNNYNYGVVGLGPRLGPLRLQPQGWYSYSTSTTVTIIVV